LRITYRRACLKSASQSLITEYRAEDSWRATWIGSRGRCTPFWLEFLENFPLCVVTDDLDVYETTKIKPLGSELGPVAKATRAVFVDWAVVFRFNQAC
jgi:hypothetical protein